MSINYYVVGSIHEYEDRHTEDMLEYMRKHHVVSVAWAGEVDLSPLVGSTKEKITDCLNHLNRSDACPSLKLFLNLKPDDIIAVKKWNMKDRKGSIIVYAYARVVGDKQDKIIYRHDKNKGRHMINVEYIETKGLPITFPFNYARTIYHITKPERIKKIFGPYHEVEFR